ncbi:Uncharacterised protein [Streptococcus massiliensis]|uniref:Uncharacterized protein n=1 Tax=Streptococcus massiliensis TaxID=313439 RepID=A0A380KYV7_9STRE|nr:Uncharacterised protein [Streptococcus massiliensis]
MGHTYCYNLVKAVETQIKIINFKGVYHGSI